MNRPSGLVQLISCCIIIILNSACVTQARGRNDHLALYRPGTGTIWIVQNVCGRFNPVYRQGDPGYGIGGYNLGRDYDRAFAFDYNHSGHQDHIVLYRPGTGTIWIVRQGAGGSFYPVYSQGDPGIGIGGYDLARDYDRVFAFDYQSTGKQDHLVLYRPGTGSIHILQNQNGQFRPVYVQPDPGYGIGGYDLKREYDRIFPFDFDHSGKNDHLVIYRPGTGSIWILKNTNGTFSPVYLQQDPGAGIGGYDLKSSADRMFAFDYNGSGKTDHLALYRPGTGHFWIMANINGNFVPVYKPGGSNGYGIGGYDVMQLGDRAFAFDYEHTGKLDHIVLYRPGYGTIWILKNTYGTFSPVPKRGDGDYGEDGVGGYSLRSTADRIFAFDYVSGQTW